MNHKYLQRRKLTEGEIRMAAQIFADSIDYSKVRVYRINFPRIKNSRTAMAPKGHILFPACVYESDFSVLDAGKKQWFIHEMTHVWQYQRGHSVLWSGIILFFQGGYTRKKNAYQINPAYQENWQFSQFNIEQQAELVAYYFAHKYLKCSVSPEILACTKYILKEFLSRPNQKSLLPQRHRTRSI